MKFKSALIIILSSLLLLSCGNSYVLSEEELEDVLVDIHIVEGMTVSTIKEFRKDEAKTDLYNFVFEKHGTDKAQFDSTMSYYSNDLAVLVEVYDNVFDRLVALETKAKDGQFSLSKDISSQVTYSRIMSEDSELLPYVVGELWKSKRDLLFSKKDFNHDATYKMPIDSLTSDKLNLLFTVEAKDLDSASIDLITYYGDESTTQSYRLPLDTVEAVNIAWDESKQPTSIVMNVSAGATDAKATLRIKNIRFYNLSDEKHDISFLQ